MRNFLNPEISTIFMMLGSGCNFNCEYCLQQPLLREPKKKINSDIYDFIKNTAENQKNPLTLQFYGGEPFLYFEEIQEIVENLRNTPNLIFSAISNGSLITEDIVDFCNTNKMGVAISWDGPNTIKTRHKNVLINKELRNNFLKINRLSFSSIITSFTYPIETINALIPFIKKYRKLHDYDCGLNFDIVFDTGIRNRNILKINNERLYKEEKKLCSELRKKILGKKNNIYYSSIAGDIFNGLIQSVKYKKNLDMSLPRCGNGIDVYNLDLMGNLYKCHNSSEKIGTIYNSFRTYLYNMVNCCPIHDLMNECNCKDCPVQVICQTGCPLVSLEARKESFCDTRRAFYLPYIELLQNVSIELKEITKDFKESLKYMSE